MPARSSPGSSMAPSSSNTRRSMDQPWSLASARSTTSRSASSPTTVSCSVRARKRGLTSWSFAVRERCLSFSYKISLGSWWGRNISMRVLLSMGRRWSMQSLLLRSPRSPVLLVLLMELETMECAGEPTILACSSCGPTPRSL